MLGYGSTKASFFELIFEKQKNLTRGFKILNLRNPCVRCAHLFHNSAILIFYYL